MMERKNNVVPVITHPLGSSWKQPLAASILIDDTHALMWKSDFDKLANYSMSTPTGAYEGKMWKCEHPLGSGRWFLYCPSDREEFLATEVREILTYDVPSREEFYGSQIKL